jgi:hypothetical protein
MITPIALGRKNKKISVKSETLSPFSALCRQDERKKHKLGPAVVAKGVSPPSLGLWLLICLFSNKSAALPGRAFVF